MAENLPASQKKKYLPMKQRVQKIQDDYAKHGKLPKLTPKRRIFLAKYLDIDDKEHFFNALRCVWTVFNPRTDANARSMAWETSEILRPWIDQFLNDLCFSESAVKAKVLSLMHARKTQFFSHKGKVTDKREVEALDIQIKAANLASEIKGMKKKEQEKPMAVFNLNFGNMAVQITGPDNSD